MRNDIMKHKPCCNSSKSRKASILDILVSQKRLHKPKTSTKMLWIGCDHGDGRRRRSKNSGGAALSNNIFITNTFISSFMILLHILQPSVVALQKHNKELLQQSSSLIYVTNINSSDSKIPSYILHDDRKPISKNIHDDHKDATACLTRVSAVVEANSPELLVLPNEEELSAFTTSRLHIKVAWSHIDSLLTANGDKWCVGSYLIEYGPYKYERHKRESESSSAEVSPALGRDKTEYTLVLDDNCIVYSVHLVVIPAVVVKKPSKLNDLITSGRRKFWPAAYRTVLDVYSDSAVVSWPPSCSYMTNDWNLEACPIVTSNNFNPSEEDSDGVHVKPEYSCVHVDLSSESTVHMANLLPCKFYQFRLKAFGDLLWTFAPSRTLPTPQVDSKSFTNAIHLTINQNGNCDAKALVHHWRVQYCEHEDDEHDNEIFLDAENDVEKERLKRKAKESNKRHLIDSDGSGFGTSDDEDNRNGGMEYYEDVDLQYTETEEISSNQKSSSSNCQSVLYDISSSKGKIKIRHLKECTLYTVDVSPVDANGHSIRPSEQFGSVHSTLCPGNDDDDQESDSFWFGDENGSDIQGKEHHLQNGQKTNTQLIPMSEQHEDDSMPLSILSLTILILVSVTIFLALIFIIMYKIQRKRYLFKTSTSCNGHQPMSLVSSSSSKIHRILNRVGKTFNDGKNHNNEDHHLSSSNVKHNMKGHQDSNKKCQKVLIATSGKNGVVENKSICSSKINNSKSNNSLTFSNLTTTEEDGDVSSKTVLLNFN